MFLKVARLIFSFITYTILGLRVYGRENVPSTGGVIVAPNHCSNLDPVLVGVALPRMIYFMAKEELFRNWGMNKVCRALGAFPLHRGTVDKVAMRTAMGIIRRGDLLGIFPEGTRVRSGILGRFHGGMASMAVRLGVPILPVAIVGSGNASFRSSHLVVEIGKPIEIEKGKATPDNVEKINDLVRKEIEFMVNKHKGTVNENSIS